MDADPKALFDSQPPRDPAALGPIVKAATRLHRLAFYIAVGLVAVLAVMVVLGADRDKLSTALPAATLVPLVLFGAPFLVFWLRGRSRLTTLAVQGSLHRARVTVSKVIHVGYGAKTNHIEAAFSAGGVDYVTALAAGGPELRHVEGDEIRLFFSPSSPTVIIAYSEALGIVLGRTMTRADSAAPRRAGRIVIGVIVGALLFFGLIAVLCLRQGR